MPKAIEVLIGSTQWGPLRYRLEPQDEHRALIELDTSQTVNFDPTPLLESLRKVWQDISEVGEGKWKGMIPAQEAQAVIADLVNMSSVGGAFKVSGDEITYFISGDVVSHALSQSMQQQPPGEEASAPTEKVSSDDAALPF